MLEASLLALRQDSAKGDLSLAYIHHLVVGRAGRILHMRQREPMREAIEIIQWISAAKYDPVDVHLEVDEPGVRLTEQNVERPHAVDRLQLEVVVVVRKPKS